MRYRSRPALIAFLLRMRTCRCGPEASESSTIWCCGFGDKPMFTRVLSACGNHCESRPAPPSTASLVVGLADSSASDPASLIVPSPLSTQRWFLLVLLHVARITAAPGVRAAAVTHLPDVPISIWLAGSGGPTVAAPAGPAP